MSRTRTLTFAGPIETRVQYETASIPWAWPSPFPYSQTFGGLNGAQLRARSHWAGGCSANLNIGAGRASLTITPYEAPVFGAFVPGIGLHVVLTLTVNNVTQTDNFDLWYPGNTIDQTVTGSYSLSLPVVQKDSARFAAPGANLLNENLGISPHGITFLEHLNPTQTATFIVSLGGTTKTISIVINSSGASYNIVTSYQFDCTAAFMGSMSSHMHVDYAFNAGSPFGATYTTSQTRTQGGDYAHWDYISNAPPTWARRSPAIGSWSISREIDVDLTTGVKLDYTVTGQPYWDDLSQDGRADAVTYPGANIQWFAGLSVGSAPNPNVFQTGQAIVRLAIVPSVIVRTRGKIREGNAAAAATYLIERMRSNGTLIASSDCGAGGDINVQDTLLNWTQAVQSALPWNLPQPTDPTKSDGFTFGVRLGAASITAADDQGGESPMMIRGRRFLTGTLHQVDHVVHEDGSSTAGWAGINGSVISTLAGVLSITYPNSNSKATKTFSPQVRFAGYGFERFRVKSDIEGDWTVRIISTNANSPFLRKEWPIHVTTSFSDAIIDLCLPHNYPNWTYENLDSNYPLVGFLAQDGCFFGVGEVLKIEIEGGPTGSTLQIDYIEGIRHDRIDALQPKDSKVNLGSGNQYDPTSINRGVLYLVAGGNVFVQILSSQGRIGVEDNYPYRFAFPNSTFVRVEHIRPYLIGNTEGRKSFELPDSIGERPFGQFTAVQPLPLWLAFDVVQGLTPLSVVTPFPGWNLSRATIALTTYQNLNRPAYWLFGGGAQYLGGEAWDFNSMQDMDAGNPSSPLDLYAQELWTYVQVYPDAGDVFELDGGAFGFPIELHASKVLRGGVDGLLGDDSNARLPDIEVKLERQSDSEDGGSGTSNTRGFYETGNPYGHDGQVYKVTPQVGSTPYQSGLVNIVPRYRQRRSFRRQAEGTGVSYDVSEDGRKARASVNGTIRVEIAQNVAATSWHEVDTEITGNHPEIRWEKRQVNPKLWLTYEADGKAYALWTRDEGRTWSMPLTIYDSGPPKWPRIVCTADGRRFHYWRDPGGSGKILGKCFDAFDNLILPVDPDDLTFTAIASNVDDDMFGADDHTQGQGGWRMHICYRSGGTLLDVNSANGMDFS